MLKEDRIKLLQDIVQIKSVNEKEEEVANYLQKVLAKYGVDSHLVNYSPGRSNLIAELGEDGGKVLGFTGHLDVVEAGDESQWTYPPFNAHIEGNKMYGRGTTDMKSGLAAMVIAMIELKEKEVPLKGKIKLLATVGEEVGELGAMQLTEQGYADELDALIIGEPTNYNVAYTHMGSINYTVISRGKGAHSSMPKEGINAINYLNQFITLANDEMDAVTKGYQDDTLGRTIHNVTLIEGGVQVNSIPESARLQANIRSIPSFSNTQIIEILQGVVDKLNKQTDCSLELIIDFNKEAVKSPKDSDVIKSIQRVSDKDLPLIGISATTDAAEFTKSKTRFDVAIYGPGEPTLPHQIDEYVEIDNYLDMIDQFQAVAIDYLNN